MLRSGNPRYFKREKKGVLVSGKTGGPADRAIQSAGVVEQNLNWPYRVAAAQFNFD